MEIPNVMLSMEQLQVLSIPALYASHPSELALLSLSLKRKETPRLIQVSGFSQNTSSPEFQVQP